MGIRSGARTAAVARGTVAAQRGRALLAAAALVVFAVAFAALAACGGGSPTSPPPPPPPPPAGLTFTPGGTSGGAAIVLSRTGATGGRDLDLAVEARQVGNLYGVAFDLGYPASVLSYQGATPGDFLEASGFQVSLQVAEQSGNLIVGVTRLGAVPGASGSGTLVTLRFRSIASGTGSLSFTRSEAVDADGRPIGGVSFVGGSVQSTL
jgi:hypothetical protein